MITENSYVGGLNQDLAKTKLQNSNYIDASNVRLITNEGQSTGSLTNIRGNKLAFNMSDTYPVYKISVDLVGPYAAGTFTIQTQTSAAAFTPSVNTTGQDIYNFIDGDANLTNFTLTYNIAVANNYIIIYSTNLDTVPSFAGTGLTVSVEVPAQQKLVPIGFTVLRDDIYIYSTPNVTKNPGGHDSTLSADASSTGQIFKLIYNPVTYATTLELIYNNYLDFTTYRNIPTTANVGRYENVDTQRLYWTDFNNSLRSINVKDPNIMALSPLLLDIKPPVTFSMPTLQKVVTGGSIPVSVCQLVYRLKNTGGSITNYSEPSNMVFIVGADESINTGGSGFKDYIGANQGTIAGKSIKWQINDIDTNFDRIELVVLRRESLTGSVDIIQFADEPVPADGTMEVTYDGNIELSTIALNEFLAISGAFTHCKTIGSKDNILFVGNVKRKFSDIDYDARAFRALTSNAVTTDILLTNDGVDEAGRTLAQAIATSQTSDAINKYSDAARDCYFKPNTPGGILGGAGANISYEFGTVAIRADSTVVLTSPMSGADYRHTNPEYLVTQFDLDVKRIDNTNEQTYPSNSINDDIKYVYYSGLYKGYERSEIYRFGITFFDRQKNPIFVKWIGDIKMPNYDDLNNNPLYETGAAAPHADFRSSFAIGTTSWVNQLFIKFTVSIPVSISKIIDGYTICRVERTEENKTILGSGLLTQLYSDGGQFYLPDLQIIDDGGICYGGFTSLNITALGTATGQSPKTFLTFDCPEFLLGGYGGYKSGDTLQIVEKHDPTYQNILLDAGTVPYRISKFQASLTRYSGPANQIAISEAGICEFASTFQFTGWQFNNFTRSSTNTSDALGSKTLCIGLGANLEWGITYGCDEASGDKLLAQYIRTLSSQYGGNTYSARSNNEYISCSHYRPIKEYTTTVSDVFQVFGGDVFTQMYDNQKEIKNWGQTARGQFVPPGIGCAAGTDSKASITFFFPCTASHNTDLRHGTHVNHNLDTDDGSGASATEDQIYNTVYSSENNIKKFFPKPTEFSLEEEFDNRFYYSGVKINGELSDSWGVFDTNNYWDVEGIYGPVNAMIPLGDNMLFWQDKAFGSLMINPLAISTDANGISTILGKGDVIQKHNYISNSVGTKHQNSVIKSDNSVYWIDINNRKLYKASSSGIGSLSEIKGIQSFFNNFIGGQVINSDRPVYHTGTYRTGILGYFDSKYKEVVFTIHDFFGVKDSEIQTNKTICYNELTDTFTSFYSYKPYIYIWDNIKYYSINTDNYNTLNPAATQKIYIHDKDSNYGQIYGSYTDSYIKLLINPNPSLHKIFDNLKIQTETQTLDVFGVATDEASGVTPIQDTFDRLRVTTDYQDTGTINLTINTNIRRILRYWKTAIPKDSIGSPYTTFKPRMRDFYANVELYYLNSGKRLIIHNLLTEYRQMGIPVTSEK